MRRVGETLVVSGEMIGHALSEGKQNGEIMRTRNVTQDRLYTTATKWGKCAERMG
jgi:hypothetical protein